MVKWIMKLFTSKCKHTNKTVRYKDYTDRYFTSICDDCGEEIYEDF